MTAEETPTRARRRRTAGLARLMRRAVLLALVVRAAVAPLAIHHHTGDTRHGGGALIVRACAWPPASRGVGLSDRLRESVASAPGVAPAAIGPGPGAIAARGLGPLADRAGPAFRQHSPLRC